MSRKINFLFILTFCAVNFTIIQAADRFPQKSPIKIRLVRDNFISISNQQHPGNRIGYRFFEHSPIEYGRVPLFNKEAAIDSFQVNEIIRNLSEQKEVFVYRRHIPKSNEWVEQKWTYYMVPVQDGIELFWIIETFNDGLPDYYGVQQCFRLSGETNKKWRQGIARTPAFSEYDLWAREKGGSQKTSLTYVRRHGAWQALLATEEAVGARTPLGIAVDDLHTSGKPMPQVGPYRANMLAPIDDGLIIRSDQKNQMVCGIYWQNTSHVTDHHPADCLHAIVNIGNIPPRSRRVLHGKIYWFKGNRKELYTHFEKDFGEATVKGKLIVAASQFPVSDKIQDNARWIKKHIRQAKLRGADVVHFPEAALSGYGGADVKDFKTCNWDLLKSKTDSIAALAKELKIWVLLGSAHRLTPPHRPHNSLYVINPDGQIIDRYDKRFCTSGDLKYYTPGDHFVTFQVHGVKCGLLICYDVRFPELYREYRKLGVDVIFQSFYNARHKPDCIHPKIMPVTAQARAATNYFFMSLTNSSAPFSWPCHFILPNGLIEKKLPANRPGLLLFRIDTTKKYYDPSKPFRIDAMSGKLNSGETVQDPRSEDRTHY